MLIDSKRILLAIGFVIAACFSTQLTAAEDDNKVKTPDAVKADNTKVNLRDRDAGEATADQQKQNKSDVELAASIRKAVVKDDSLSTNAHNVKIIAIDGMVTLKGPVKSEVEKAAVEKIAVSVAGEKNVKSLIDIAP